MSNYGFYGRLSSHFPSQIIVDVTEICNLECVHCPHPEFKKGPHYEGRRLSEELNAKMVHEVATDGKGHTEYIRYTSNGEPLTHPKIYDFLTEAAQKSETKVVLTTNGVLLRPANIEKLLMAGVHLIDISLDAFHDDTYAKIRRKGDLKLVRQNVLNLIDMKNRIHQSNNKTKVVVSYIEQPDNMQETDLFRLYWKEKGADSVIIRKLHSAAGAITEWSDKQKAMGKEPQSSEKRRPCVYPWERITLNAEGMLSFCPTDWLHESNVVDYSTTTIKETWSGAFYNKLRNAHLDNNFSCHQFCGKCPDWQLTEWPAQGRAYANLVAELVQNP